MVGLGKRKIKTVGRAVRPINRRATRVGNGVRVRAIDTPIRAVGRRVSGTRGTQGRVGRPVKAINRKTSGADDIFDPL